MTLSLRRVSTGRYSIQIDPQIQRFSCPRPSWTVTVLENLGVVLGHSLNHISCLDAYNKSFSFIPNSYRHNSAKNSLKVACVVTVRDVLRESGFVNMIPWPYTVNYTGFHSNIPHVKTLQNTKIIKTNFLPFWRKRKNVLPIGNCR